MDRHPVISVQQQTSGNDFCHFSISNVSFAFCAFFSKTGKTRVSHRVKMMTRWHGDPDVKGDPNDPLTRWPNDPVPCLVAALGRAVYSRSETNFVFILQLATSAFRVASSPVFDRTVRFFGTRSGWQFHIPLKTRHVTVRYFIRYLFWRHLSGSMTQRLATSNKILFTNGVFSDKNAQKIVFVFGQGCAPDPAGWAPTLPHLLVVHWERNTSSTFPFSPFSLPAFGVSVSGPVFLNMITWQNLSAFRFLKRVLSLGEIVESHIEVASQVCENLRSRPFHRHYEFAMFQSTWQAGTRVILITDYSSCSFSYSCDENFEFSFCFQFNHLYV